jgi:hypothetical protein
MVANKNLNSMQIAQSEMKALKDLVLDFINTNNNKKQSKKPSKYSRFSRHMLKCII